MSNQDIKNSSASNESDALINHVRPRRGVVAALDEHFRKYDPTVIEDITYPDDDNFIGHEAAA